MIYILTLAFCLFCPVASYCRFRSPFHPHVIFTLSWVFLLPLGSVISPSIPDYLLDLQHADAGEINSDQILVLAFLSVLFGATLFLPRNAFKVSSSTVSKSLNLMKRNSRLLGAVALTILGLEVGKQLYACDWSVRIWYEYSTGPRFGRPWLGGYVGSDDFLFTLIGNLFFAPALFLPMALTGTKGLTRVVIACGELTTLFILVCNGSRTPVALTLLVIGLLWHFSAPNPTLRLAGHVLLVSALVVIT